MFSILILTLFSCCSVKLETTTVKLPPAIIPSATTAPLEDAECSSDFWNSMNPHYQNTVWPEVRLFSGTEDVVVRGDSIGFGAKPLPGFYGLQTKVYNVGANQICDMVRQAIAIRTTNPKSMVVWSTGTNDLAHPLPRILKDVDILIFQAHQRWPNTHLVLVGVHKLGYGFSNSESTRQSLNSELKSRMQGNPMGCYVDPDEIVTSPENQLFDGVHLKPETLWAMRAAILLQCHVSL